MEEIEKVERKQDQLEWIDKWVHFMVWCIDDADMTHSTLIRHILDVSSLLVDVLPDFMKENRESDII